MEWKSVDLYAITNLITDGNLFINEYTLQKEL